MVEDHEVIDITSTILARAELEHWKRIQEILEARRRGEGLSPSVLDAIRKSGERLESLKSNRQEES